VARGFRLPENSGLSMQIIAERCGFKTRTHFSRKVKQIAGCTPREIRSRHWKQPHIG